MCAGRDQDHGGVAGRAGEQPVAPAEVDNQTGRVDDDPTNMPGECIAENIVRMELDAGGGLASPILQRDINVDERWDQVGVEHRPT